MQQGELHHSTLGLRPAPKTSSDPSPSGGSNIGLNHSSSVTPVAREEAPVVVLGQPQSTTQSGRHATTPPPGFRGRSRSGSRAQRNTLHNRGNESQPGSSSSDAGGGSCSSGDGSSSREHSRAASPEFTGPPPEPAGRSASPARRAPEAAAGVCPPTPQWLQRAHTAVGLDAPLIVGAGLTAIAPEAVPVTAEAIPAISDASEAAVAWASLNLENIHNSEPLPNTLSDLVSRVRQEIDKPTFFRAYTGDHALAEDAARIVSDERDRRLAALRKWLSEYGQTFLAQSGGADSAASAAISTMFSTTPLPSVAPPAITPPTTVPSSLVDYSYLDHTPVCSRKSIPKRPSYEQPADGIWVKTGDHSIEATCITSSLLLDDQNTAVGPGDFIRQMGGRLAQSQNQFVYQAGIGIKLTSMLSVSAPGGGYTPPVAVQGLVLPYHEQPLNAGPLRHDLVITVQPAREMGQFTLASLAGFMTNGVANEKLVKDAIGPELMLANRNATTRLASAITRGLRYFDNELLYAKLIFYSLLLDECTFSQTGVDAVDYGSADAVVATVNLDDVNLGVDVLTNLIIDSRLVVFDGRDVYVQDTTQWQILRWIAAAGCRVTGAVGVPTPHACCVHWPAIPVTALIHGAPPGPPAAALVTSVDLLGFALSLATLRHEWKSYVRGLYIALDLIGLRMPWHADAFWCVKSNLSRQAPALPNVADYNFMFRLLGSLPPLDSDAKAEAEAYATLSAVDRVRCAVLYTAVLSSATTTLLYDVNLTSDDIVSWADHVPAISQILVAVLRSGLNICGPAYPNNEPALIKSPKKAFKLWLGVGVEGSLYPNNTWCGDYGADHHFAEVYAAIPHGIPPRFFNPLIVDNWLNIRPIEWGLVGPRPKVNLLADINVMYMSEARRGWYGSKGSSSYGASIFGKSPMRLVVYGAQAINVITQTLRIGAAAAPVISHQFSGWWGQQGEGHGYEAEWDPPVAEPAANHPYMSGLWCFEPCSVMSFNYGDNAIWAPCIVGAALPAASREALRGYCGQVDDSAGVMLNGLEAADAPVNMFGAMDLGFLSEVAKSAPDTVVVSPCGNAPDVNHQ